MAETPEKYAGPDTEEVAAARIAEIKSMLRDKYAGHSDRELLELSAHLATLTADKVHGIERAVGPAMTQISDAIRSGGIMKLLMGGLTGGKTKP